MALWSKPSSNSAKIADSGWRIRMILLRPPEPSSRSCRPTVRVNFFQSRYRQPQYETIAIPLTRNLAAELAINRGVCQSGAETFLMRSLRNLRAATFCPYQEKMPFIGGAFDLHGPGWDG